MNILVCVKQVPDTTEIKIDPVTNTLIRSGVPSIVNPFDGYALEAAARIKDAHPDAKIVVMSMGPGQAQAALKECLAIAADKAAATAADDQYVAALLPGLSDLLGLNLGVEVGRIQTGLCEAVLHGGGDGEGGNGGAGNGVDGQGLLGHDILGDPLNGGIADAGGLAVAEHLDGGDSAVGNGDLHRYIAVFTGAHAGVGAVLQAGGGGGGDEARHVGQLRGVGGGFVPLHIDAQQLGDVTDGSVSGAVIGKHFGGLPVGLGGGDGVAVDIQIHGGDSDALLCPGCQSNRAHDHDNGQREGGDPFLHGTTLLYFFSAFWGFPQWRDHYTPLVHICKQFVTICYREKGRFWPKMRPGIL